MTKLEKLAAVASIVSSLAAASALFWNVYVFKETSEKNEAILTAAIDQQNKNVAIELYREYLSLAFQYPDFVFDEVDILKVPEKEGKKYIVFAASSITIAERIYELQKGDKEMEAIVKSIVRNHLFFINQNCKEIGDSFKQYLSNIFPGIKCI